MPAAEDIAPLIRELGDANDAIRERAGVAIFRRGCELAEWSTQAWFVDADLAACIVRDSAGNPEMTVGVAVRPQTFEKIRAACGSPPLADVPPNQDAREFEIELPGGTRLDVLTTAAPEGSGAIARFLERTGEAIQQVEIEVNDLDRATELLRTHVGISPVYPTTRAGADGARVNFFLVPAAENRKVLIELVDDPRREGRTAPK